MASFASLPPEQQEEIRRKQREKKAAKTQLRRSSTEVAPSAPMAVEAPKDYPDRITISEYAGACPFSRFCDPSLGPTEENLELLLSVLASEEPGKERLNKCNYFQFSGPMDSLWDPVFNARLAYEGFFTITTGRGSRTEPLPELQPFYGVLTWENFEAAKHVRKTLARLRRGGQRYKLVVSTSLSSWEAMNAYQVGMHGVNWLTRRYFDMMRAASAEPTVNFRAHCVELFCEDEGTAIAGEIGYSIGKVYTSLSGWTGRRTREGAGTVQLVLLGRWLKQRGYAFWSLGHCYSPEMEYKRQLGHRIYPRADFLALLKKHRGEFRLRGAQDPACLADGDECGSERLVGAGAEDEGEP